MAGSPSNFDGLPAFHEVKVCMHKVWMAIYILLLITWPVSFIYGQDKNRNGVADRFDLPGTQPNRVLPAYDGDYNIDVEILDATECQRCHTKDDRGPFGPWSGSMMANSSRDPVFWAQLDLAEGDEKMDPAHMAGARDLCLRCHISKGWLEGRSSGNIHALRGMNMREEDLLGVQCEICHRMVDPAQTNTDAVDQIMLKGLKTNPDQDLQIPPGYGNAMYVLDRTDVRRGPYSDDQIGWPFLKILSVKKAADWPPSLRHVKNHFIKDSAFHRSGNLCGTCHDVSNPAWTPDLPKGEAQKNFPIERTWSEWKYSRYSTIGEEGNCQSCHMSGPLNGIIDGGTSVVVHDPAIHLNDVHVHDLTGGNVWIPRIIAEMIARFEATKHADPGLNPTIGTSQAERDMFLEKYYAAVLRAVYPAGTFLPANTEDLHDWFWYRKSAYQEASDRASETLKRAAELSGSRAFGGDLKVRIWNKTGHKLPTGYPEGRRMWLEVRFLDVNPKNGAEELIAQSGEYNAEEGILFHDFNLDNKPGPLPYDIATYTDGKGRALSIGRRTQVYESRGHHKSTHKEFHFILNNELLRDNRIPPLGWNKKAYSDNNAGQVINPAYKDSQMEYHDAKTGPAKGLKEESYNFDEVAYPVPADSDVAEVVLWYQSVSKEYIEELVASSPRILVYPEGSGKKGFTRGDILEHAWRTFQFEGKKRIPPTEMARLRIALVDKDEDELPDDWERANALDPSSAIGDNGSHGDIDGDGLSNYQAVQKKMMSNRSYRTRKPLDLVLVLDFSGSMKDPAPAGSRSTIEALKNAVELFLKTWKQFAIKNDRIGIVYFSDTVDVEGRSGLIDLSTLPSGTTTEDKVDQLIAAIRSHQAGGHTAIGGGLQKALNMLQNSGSGHGKHIILFSNGMQNYNPMVQKDASGNYFIANVPLSSSPGVFGNSGVTDRGGPTFGTRLNTLGIQIHTIGIGVSEITDTFLIDLLKGISDNTKGSHLFSPGESQLEGVFLHNLIETQRGSSSVMVAEDADFLNKNEISKTFEYQMDAAATKAAFILSWAGTEIPGRLIYELITPEGKSAQGLGRLTEGANYLIGMYNFPLFQNNGRPARHEGTWKMMVRRQSFDKPWPNKIDFRTYLLVDISDMEFLFLFSKNRYEGGDEVELEAVVLDHFNPIRTQCRVKAAITRLSKGVGTFLSQAHVNMDQIEKEINVYGDPLPHLAASKIRLALMDPGLVKSIPLIREEIVLHDDGNPEHGDFSANDGLFSAKLDIAHVPGLIYADVGIEGKSARTGAFTRRLRVVTIVGHGKFSSEKSLIKGTILGDTEDGRSIIQIKVTPVDEFGNYLGPGYSSQVSIELHDFTGDSQLQDNLDGSYTREFKLRPGELFLEMKIAVGDKPFFKGSIASLLKGLVKGELR